MKNNLATSPAGILIASKDNQVIAEIQLDNLFINIARKDETVNGERKITPIFWLGQFVLFDKNKIDTFLSFPQVAIKRDINFKIIETVDNEKYCYYLKSLNFDRYLAETDNIGIADFTCEGICQKLNDAIPV